MSAPTSSPELLVDFNGIEAGTVSGLVEDLRGEGGQPAPAAGIVVLDDEGHRAHGTIRRVARGVVDVEVDWSTWTTAP